MKFKVGDRVAFYTAEGRGTGKIVMDDGDGTIGILSDKRDSARVHPKQCRLLKKKERRRMWISKKILEELLKDNKTPIYDSKPEYFHLYSEFIEVKKCGK